MMICNGWYNFDTKSYDNNEGPPNTDEQAIQYIPQGPARGLYGVYRKMGDDILKAMEKALKAAAGVPNDN